MARSLTALSSSTSNRTNSQALVVSVLAFVLLLSFATAQTAQCSIDLSLIPSDFGNRGFAECEGGKDGCSACNFSLPDLKFEYGEVICTAKVPCLVEISSFSLKSMKQTKIDGSLASTLTVITSKGKYPWTDATIIAPIGGDFLFKSYTLALDATKIVAMDSRVVEIVIGEDSSGAPNFWGYPELASMDVYASNAKDLIVSVETGSLYSMGGDSRIECPMQGTCLWKSFGERYDGDDTGVVAISVAYNDTNATTTVPQFICAKNNSQSCAGVYVYCGDEEDSCEMTFGTNTWYCRTDLGEGCDASNAWTTVAPTTTPPPTSTRLNTTTTEVPITSTQALEPTTTKGKEDKDDSGFDSNLFLVILGVGFGALCVGFSANFVWVRREELRHPRTYVMQKYNDLKDSFKGEVSEMDRNQQLYLAQLGVGQRSRSH